MNYKPQQKWSGENLTNRTGGAAPDDMAALLYSNTCSRENPYHTTGEGADTYNWNSLNSKLPHLKKL